jgi:hypothetical protein
MIGELVSVPLATPSTEMVGASPDYTVNGFTRANFNYVDWEGNPRSLGSQKTPIRIQFRSVGEITRGAQMVINPVTRSFTVYLTNPSTGEIYTYVESDLVEVPDSDGNLNKIGFVNLDLRPSSQIMHSGKLCLQMILLIFCFLFILAAVGVFTYQLSGKPPTGDDVA